MQRILARRTGLGMTAGSQLHPWLREAVDSTEHECLGPSREWIGWPGLPVIQFFMILAHEN